MIDYSKYNLAEMQAIVTVLDDLTDEMSVVEGYGPDFHIALSEFMRAFSRAMALIEQQAAEQDQPSEAPAAADPPAPPDMFGWVGDALDDLCAAGEVFGNER